MGKIINFISIPFSYFINFLLNITNSFPLTIILFSVFFAIAYGTLSTIQGMVSTRMVFANKYVPIFQKRYVNDKKVFDTYLTKIYKACKVNQLSNIIFGVVMMILFISVATVVFQPLTSIFRISSDSLESAKFYLTNIQGAPKDLSEYGVLDFILQNKEKLAGTDIAAINSILQYKLDFLGSSFFAAPQIDSVFVVLPLFYLLMFGRSVIKSFKNAIKKKTTSSFLSFGLTTFFFISVFTAAFFFPVSYIAFLVLYRVVSLIIAPIQKKLVTKYFKSIEGGLKDKCEDILKEAEELPQQAHLLPML